MNCDNCGKEQVNFHYTSNINGNITEKHLCADCAEKLGFNIQPQVKEEASPEELFPGLFGGAAVRPLFSGVGMVMPTFVIPTFGLIIQLDTSDATIDEQEKTAEEKPDEGARMAAEIDDEMKKRREINVLREEMNKAAAADDFEKAAALRDSIKKLEAGDNR